MQGPQIAVAAANGLFALACGTVGIRLLLLSRRTHGLPEFYLGVGFVGMVSAMVVLGASGLGRRPVGEVDFLLLSIGMLLMWLAIGTQASFTWSVFRPEDGWAEALVLGIGAASAVIVGGALHTLGGADPAASSFEAAGDWMLLLRIPLAVVYIWTGYEAWIQYRMARRREALGIGDRVVSNRLALWATNALVSLSCVLVSCLLHLQGRGPLADPRAAAVLGLGGLAGAVLLYLAFIPPRWYLRRITAAVQDPSDLERHA